MAVSSLVPASTAAPILNTSNLIFTYRYFPITLVLLLLISTSASHSFCPLSPVFSPLHFAFFPPRYLDLWPHSGGYAALSIVSEPPTVNLPFSISESPSTIALATL